MPFEQKKSKIIVRDGNGNLVQMLPEIAVDTALNAESALPLANSTLTQILTNDVVHTTGNETINGDKTFTGTVYAYPETNEASIKLKSNRVDRANAPENGQATIGTVQFVDKNDKTIGRIEAQKMAEGDVQMKFSTYNESISNDAAGIELHTDVNGKTVASAPTPANASDSSSKIATTEWVRTATGNIAANAASATKTKGIYFITPNETTSTAALTATEAGITEYFPGLTVALRMPFDNAYNTSLNINGLGAKPIYYQNTNTNYGMFPYGSVVMLVYETISNSNGCFKAIYSYDVSYLTRLYAADSSNATSNSYSETSSDSTYLVLSDSRSRGGVQVLGTGGASVTAERGVLKVHAPLESESVSNELIDTLFDGGYIYTDKQLTFNNNRWSGNGTIYFVAYAAEDGSDTGIDGIRGWDAAETEKNSNDFVIQSNTDYVLTPAFWTLNEFLTSNLSGIRMKIIVDDENGTSHTYSTAGKSVPGCEDSPHDTFSGTLVNAEYYNYTDLSESDYWSVVEFDPADINTGNEEIKFYLNYECSTIAGEYADGRFIDQDSSRFEVTLFKDQGGTNVMVKIRYICVLEE